MPPAPRNQNSLPFQLTHEIPRILKIRQLLGSCKVSRLIRLPDAGAMRNPQIEPATVVRCRAQPNNDRIAT